MELTPVVRRSVADDVFEQLQAQVVVGDLGPGAPLPSERRLAEALGVSRPAVREALQRLAQAGLVDIRQGDTTTVRDFRRHGGLDLLPRLLLTAHGLDVAVARSILEARAHIGPKIAELAARRGGPDLAPALSAALTALRSTNDPVSRQHRAVDFWQLLVDAADSITFRLMFNGMLAAYLPAVEALAEVMRAEVEQDETYAALADAVIAGDSENAPRLAAALLAPTSQAVQDALNTLEDPR
ncbi:FadR/GntR family transcriptional regulator [Nocardioides limicola]|uniref:FadR/GntR family transcriptional regulator n=1 Tax=Nocardioides limicola TaxID=2803368 RepID=UPI00193C6382|nr:GntR family transcriptional regulator [Nocardioides sp. DJM-14]